MTLLNEYGRRTLKPPTAPKPPKPPGHGRLGDRANDFEPPPAPKQPTVPGTLPGGLVSSLLRTNPTSPLLSILGVPQATQQPLQSGPTKQRANMQTKYKLTPSRALGVNTEAEAAAAAKITSSPSLTAQRQPVTGATSTAADVARTVLRTPTTGGTQTPTQATTQQQQTGGGQTQTSAPTTTSTQSQTGAGTTLEQIRQENASLLAGIDQRGASAIQQTSQYFQDILTLIEQTKADLISRSEEEGKSLDPATLLTLDRLKQDAQDNLTRVREVANRRGILDSGIALGMERDVNDAYGEQEAIVLSDRLSRIRQNLEEGLRGLSGQAIGVQGQRASTLSGMEQNLFNSYLNAQQQGLARVDQWRQFEAERADNAAARNAQLALNLSQMSGQVVTPVSRADQMLAEAKRRWQEAQQRGDQQGMAAAAEMGKQARAMGPTLDPNNQMTYDQLMGTINQGGSAWGQVQQGSQTASAAQAALRNSTSSRTTSADAKAQAQAQLDAEVRGYLQWEATGDGRMLTPDQKYKTIVQDAEEAYRTNETSWDTYQAVIKWANGRYQPNQQGTYSGSLQ